MLGLLNDSLDLAALEAGTLALAHRPLHLEDVVAQAFDAVRPLHVHREVNLACDWSDASLLGARGALIGDALRLQQLLASLLSLALRSTTAGGVLLRLATHPSGDDGLVPLHITVLDSGAGLTAAQLQASVAAAPQSTPARLDAQASLPLTMAARLVDRLGGQLDARSQPGAGSSFDARLRMPADPNAQPPAAAPAQQRLLLAQGHPGGREAALALLHHLGLGAGMEATSDVAGTKAALSEALQQGRPFDWLLLDSRLPGPGPTGAELLVQLRREHPALRIAVLGLPGLADDAAQLRAFGARAVLAEPLLPGALRKLLAESLPERHVDVEPPSLAGLRVLLVEDHPINQEIAMRMLGSRGAVVEVAANGQLALERLRARGPQGFDLVLMDLQMPVLDGLAATRQLRQWPGFEQLPVLAMTAHALPEEREACLTAGMQGHIAKPLDVARLVQALQAYRPRPAAQPTLDLQAGQRLFDGQAGLYRRTLQGFANQYAAGLAHWAGWAAAGEWTELRRAAHTLQGLAATVGAQPLHRLARLLEEAAAQADAAATGPQLACVQQELDAVLVQIQAALNQAWASTQMAARLAAVPPVPLAELRQLLAQSDSRALDWWQAHGTTSGLPAVLREQLDKALAAFDFDAASAALATHQEPHP